MRLGVVNVTAVTATKLSWCMLARASVYNVILLYVARASICNNGNQDIECNNTSSPNILALLLVYLELFSEEGFFYFFFLLLHSSNNVH